MEETISPGPFEAGPYLAMAVLCERVLEERDGVLSVIRVVDRFTHHRLEANVPDDMPEFGLDLFAVIALKSGSARGRHEIKLQLEYPSGLLSGKELAAPVYLEGEDRGVNVKIQLKLKIEQEGLHWFHVLFDGRRWTKIPLRVIYAPQNLAVNPS